MAVDTRRAASRRREPPAPAHDWRDWLIPSGIVAVLASISAYHHVALLEALRAWL